MSRIESYREQLAHMQDWEAYLLRESGLPGPRSNLELMHAAADLGSAAWFDRYLSLTPEQAPENTPEVFPLICAVSGLGRLLVEGDLARLSQLREFASDPRWRVREAVCMGLQRWGRADMPALLKAMQIWAQGNPMEQRAAAAALCEPDLLREEQHAGAVLDILDTITASIPARTARKAEDFRVLRKGLAYCWSVAVAALPQVGMPRFEAWLSSTDADIRWVCKENLKKKRLARLDEGWVTVCISKLEENA